MHKPTREGWLLISAIVVLLGVMFLFIFAVTSVIDYTCDGCLAKPFHSGLEEIATVAALFLLLFTGLAVGIVSWLCLVKPFCTREEIEPWIIYPGIPIYSKFAQVAFDLIFPPEA